MSASVVSARHRRQPSLPQRANRWQVLRRVLLPLLLALAGIAVLLYPVIVTQLNNAEQAQVAQAYAEQEKATPQETLNAELAEAQNYNSSRATGPILDPWLARVAEDNPGYQDYLSRLNLYDAMARVVIPKIKVDLPVYHGTSEDSLKRGIGHLYGSHLPVGGTGTHSVLTGHTGLREATLFDNLHKLEEGDAIYVGVAGEKLKYEVSEIQVVLPDDTDSLVPIPGKDLITLVTCTPYGINSHRLLVTAHRVPLEPGDDSAFEGQSTVWQWWMILLVCIAVVFILGLLWWIITMVRKSRTDSDAHKLLSEMEPEND